MTAEKMGAIITLLTIVAQAALYLISGGFSVGGKINQIESDIRIIRQEVISENQLQNYRLDHLEDPKLPGK